MRILFWSQYFWPYIGGAETFAAHLLPALRRRGHELVIVTSQAYLDLPDEAEYRGIPVYRWPFLAALKSRDVQQIAVLRGRLTDLLRRFQPDVIHSNSLGPMDFFLSGVHQIPLVITLQQRFPDQLLTAATLMGNMLRTASWLAGCSRAILTELQLAVPEIRGRSSVIYCGLQVPTIAPTPLPTDPPQLLCLGRLLDFKGFDVALQAFADLRARVPQVRLVIAGDGPARARLESQAAALGIADAVSFRGWVPPDEVPALMNSATVVVLSSRWEGLPLVALEAALMRRPIVATRAGGLPEAVHHEETGLLIDPDDAVALSGALAHLLAHPNLMAQMGDAARRRALEVFSVDTCASAHETLYARLAQHG